MTVGELIEELKKHNPASSAFTLSSSDRMDDVIEVVAEEDRVTKVPRVMICGGLTPKSMRSL